MGLVIADTPHERMLLQQMLVDACATDEMLDVGALLMKLVVKDRAFMKYGADAVVAVREAPLDFREMVMEAGWHGVEALDSRVDEIVDALVGD